MNSDTLLHESNDYYPDDEHTPKASSSETEPVQIFVGGLAPQVSESRNP